MELVHAKEGWREKFATKPKRGKVWKFKLGRRDSRADGPSGINSGATSKPIHDSYVFFTKAFHTHTNVEATSGVHTKR